MVRQRHHRDRQAQHAPRRTGIATRGHRDGPLAAAGAAADEDAIEELRGALAQANATVERLTAAVEQLTAQSQASLGFDAQHTFDCPSCGSHGTIAVPINCTNCGHEAEWGLWPGQ